jgi:hypothetical protein
VTSKALTGDFTHESIREIMALVKEVGAVEGSDEHFIATQLFRTFYCNATIQTCLES